jgi:F-type H+-transporting ATPase subunit delta
VINFEAAARPYAKALFEFAETASAELWLQTLENLVRVSTQADFQAALKEPRLPQLALADVLLKSMTDVVPPGLGNFLTILGHADRLALLPQILKQYKAALEKALRIVDVNIRSAYPLSTDYQARLVDILATRFNASIVLHVEIDPELLAGAIIRVGDWVLDGSARGCLQRLANHLTVKEMK